MPDCVAIERSRTAGRVETAFVAVFVKAATSERIGTGGRVVAAGCVKDAAAAERIQTGARVVSGGKSLFKSTRAPMAV